MKSKKYSAFLKIFSLCTAFVIQPLCMAEAQEKIRIGFCELLEDTESAASGFFRVLDESDGYDAQRFFNLPSENLDDFDVLVIFQPDPESGLDPSEIETLRDWTKKGRGLFAVFAAAGAEETAIFPNITSVSSYPCKAKEEYELEEGAVAGNSTLTDGYEPGSRYMLLTREYAALNSGADANIVLRSVEKRDGQAFSSAPLLVTGKAEKGKFAAYGSKIGGIGPIGLEKATLLNIIDWLAGKEMDITVSGEIGMNADLGETDINFAVNGNMEMPAGPDGIPQGWTLEGRRKDMASVTLSTNSYSGTHSLRFSIPATEPDQTAEQINVLPAIVNGDYRGPNTNELRIMPPNSKYTVSFRMKGDPANKTPATMHLSLYTWIDGKRSPVARAISVNAPDDWALFNFDFLVRHNTVGQGCLIEIKIEPGQGGDLNPDSTIHIDDLKITRTYGGVPKGLTIEIVIEGGEIHVEPAWQSAMSKTALEINDIPPGVPIEFSEKLLARPMYNPLPDSWKELDLSGDWKIMKLPDTHNNPSDDRGTVEGFWKPDYDDSAWPMRTVPSHWHNEDVPDPDGRMGWGSRYKGGGPENFEAVGWYRHTFTVPDDFQGERIILFFEGYDHEATVFLNGEKLGKAIGFFAPVEFDVTDTIKIGEENLLAVRLYDRPDTTYVDSRNALGGLFNRVTLQTKPSAYVSRMLIDPSLEHELCEIRLSITNSAGTAREISLTANVKPDPNQKGLVKGSGESFKIELGKVTLLPGLNEMSVDIPMKDAARWSYYDPFLYIIEFKADNEIIGKERFGFREFTQEGRFLYLNGERVSLMGAPAPSLGGISAMELENRNNILRKTILIRKQLHQNCFMPRNSMQASVRQMYDACDELGIMLYDWPGLLNVSSYSRPEEHERWFYHRYNRASVVLFVLGNETRRPENVRFLNEAYAWFKEHDKQQRPICSVSGSWARLITPDTDIVDIHLYPGTINEHAADMGMYIVWNNWETWEYYGRNMPFLAFENSGAYNHAEPDRVEVARHLLKNEPPGYRERLVNRLKAEIVDYHMPLGIRWLTLYGIRRYVIDDYDAALAQGIEPNKIASEMACANQRWSVKHVVEGCRRAGDLFQGLGINWLPRNAVARIEKGGDPDERVMIRGWQYEDIYNTLLTTPGFTEYKRYYNPTFICFDIFDKHLFSSGKLNATVYAINDTAQDSNPWSARVIIRDKAGNRLADSEMQIGTVPTFKRKLFPYEWDIPSDLETGLYTIELYLLEDGNVISDNYNEFFVMNRDELVDRIDTEGKKVALYDPLPENKAPNGITTRSVLADLNFGFDQIENFETLSTYNVLIIGSRGVDKVVDEAGETIRKWVADGGRMLVYEQSPGGWRRLKIPFFPGMEYRPGGSVVTDIIAFRHPIFEGIRRTSNWELWSGTLRKGSGARRGEVCAYRIGPLNRTMLATAGAGTPRSSNEAIQMLISEIKEGKGIMLISQPEAVRRYNIDSVATRYIQNTLKYIVSDEMPYAQGIEGFEIVNVDPHQCGYIDLTAFAEIKPDDLSDNTIEKAEQGLKDCGGLIFRSANGKIVSADKMSLMLTGDMEFTLPDSSRLMTPEWEAEKLKKDTNQLGLMHNRMEVVYILHRVKEAKEREDIGAYVFRFDDGSEIKEPIIGGLNISPIKANDKIYGARYVGDGFYATRWVNPQPDKTIKSIAVQLNSDTAELQIGGITTYLIREKIHD